MINLKKNPISWSIEKLYSKVKKKKKKEDKNQNESGPKSIAKKTISLEHLIELLSKNKMTRSKVENKMIAAYLSTHFTYFQKMKESGESAKMEKLISVLNFEEFRPGEPIIRFGEEGDKFYILLDGQVGIYKPEYVQKIMKLKEYLAIMSDIKYIEIDLLKFNRVNEKNSALRLDLDTLFKMDPNLYSMRQRYTFFIEEDQKLGEFGGGFAFGEIALIKRAKRNATIKALKPSVLVSIEKSDYNRIIRELEEKRLEKELLDFKKEFPLFYCWTLNQMIRLFNCFSKQTLTQGDYLYKQNEDPDYIYLVLSGSFEAYTLISFGWLNEFFNYIISSKNNLIRILELKKKQLKETELRELFDDLRKFIILTTFK